jgi:hypothetical protein
VELYLHSPNTPSWLGAQLKHRDFTFTFNLKGTDKLENLEIDKRIILKRILKKQGVEWIQLVQYRTKWRDLVKIKDG